MEYYKDILSRGDDLPDIITLRRFSLNDVKTLSPYLMDLSRTEVAGTFYSSYLDVNRETSGAIRWLPMCAEVDSIMANKDLFDKHGIDLPTNYSEFVAAIDAFEEQGITGFQTDWTYDYTNAGQRRLSAHGPGRHQVANGIRERNRRCPGGPG